MGSLLNLIFLLIGHVVYEYMIMYFSGSESDYPFFQICYVFASLLQRSFKTSFFASPKKVLKNGNSYNEKGTTDVSGRPER